MATRRTTRDAVLAAIDGLYAAASGTIGWDAALGRMAQTFGFPAAAMQLLDQDFNLVQCVAHGLDDSTLTEYKSYYRSLDPLLNLIQDRSKPIPNVLYTYLHTPEDQISRNEYYDWKEKRVNLVHHLGMCTKPGKPYFGFMTMQRSRAAGHAEANDVALFARLAPHLERALALEYSIGSATLRAAAEELLDGVPTGIVMLNCRGTVTYANRMARAMAGTGDAFALGVDGIKALRPSDDAGLQRLIGAALRPIEDVHAARGGAMRLPRRSGKCAYEVLVAPMTARGGLFDRMAPALCVTITDPAVMSERPYLILRQFYRVTSAEIRVAECLAAGDAPKRIAERLAISVATVREHLRALYRKTGTSGQAGLIRLLLLLPQQHGAPALPVQSRHMPPGE